MLSADGYFPLATQNDPNITTLMQAWQPIMANLSAAATKWQKQIVFAEIGYASFTGAAVQPWACCSGAPDLTTQATLYEAFFQTVWQQSWFAGKFGNATYQVFPRNP
jgi:hypothetical protein